MRKHFRRHAARFYLSKRRFCQDELAYIIKDLKFSLSQQFHYVLNSQHPFRITFFGRLCSGRKSGKYQCLQIFEIRKIKGKVVERVIATIGRMDQLQEKDRIETLIQSFTRFSEKVLLIISDKSDVSASAKSIGPALIFERLWKELGIKKVLKSLLANRRFEFEDEFFVSAINFFSRLSIIFG